MSAGLPRYLDRRCAGCGQWGASLDDRGYCDGCGSPEPDAEDEREVEDA